MAAFTAEAILSHLRSLQPFPVALSRPPRGPLVLYLPDERGRIPAATLRGLVQRGLIEEIDRKPAPGKYLKQIFDLTEEGRDLLELAAEEVAS